jgi:TatA/E family protein of Tat protein translocase
MLIGNILGSDGLIVVMIAVVVLFGGSQLPKLAKNVGAAGHEFRRAQREAEAEHAATGQAAPALTEPALVPLVAAKEDAPVSRADLRRELARLRDERDRPAAG